MFCLRLPYQIRVQVIKCHGKSCSICYLSASVGEFPRFLICETQFTTLFIKERERETLSTSSSEELVPFDNLDALKHF